MNFKDINAHDIIKFLTLNHVAITDNLYNDAIDIINSTNDIKMTDTIEYWLNAYDNQMTKFNYFSILPKEIINIIFVQLEDYKVIKLIDKKLNIIYKQNITDLYFKYERCIYFAKRHHYTNVDYHMMDTVLDVLNMKSGKLIYINGNKIENLCYTEPIKKVIDINNMNGFLTKYGKIVFMNDIVAKIPHPVTDLIYSDGYWILSNGKIYTCPILQVANMYNYDSRQSRFDDWKLLPNIKNIINIFTYDDNIYMLNSIGQLFIYDDELLLISENIKQCYTDTHLYMLKFDGQLLINLDEHEPIKF